MVKTTLKAIHGIRFLSEHLDLLEHRATTSAGKPVSILRVLATKNFALPSFFGSCLDCFFIFVLTRHECVTVFIKCFSLIFNTVFYFMCCFDISEWKAFLTETYRL